MLTATYIVYILYLVLNDIKKPIFQKNSSTSSDFIFLPGACNRREWQQSSVWATHLPGERLIKIFPIKDWNLFPCTFCSLLAQCRPTLWVAIFGYFPSSARTYHLELTPILLFPSSTSVRPDTPFAQVAGQTKNILSLTIISVPVQYHTVRNKDKQFGNQSSLTGIK